MTWWLWAVIGFGCFFSELLIPAFILIWFGFSAFILMLFLLISPDLDLAIQLFIWTLLSLIMVGVWWKFFKNKLHKSLIGRSSANIIGEEGIMIEPAAPFQNGKVRFQKPILGSDTWVCGANEELHVGQRIKVISIDGSLVTVAKTGEKQ